MKPITMLGAALALSVVAAPASAAVTVLTFDDSCELVDPCNNGYYFLQSYGDSPAIDLSHQVLSGSGAGDPVQAALHYWDSGYGDLFGVAWSSWNGVAEISFSVQQPDTSVSLLSLDAGGWIGDYESVFRIYDLSYNLLYDSGALIAPQSGHLAVDLQGISSTSGLRLQWDEAYYVAIDNLAFSVDSTSVGAVPEPATWAMMILGFGTIGGAMRRRQRPVRIRYA